MANLVKVFDSFGAAERARNELLHSGFAEPDVYLRAPDDEAGPVEGNFVLDSSDTDEVGKPGLLDRMLGREDKRKYRITPEPVWRGAYMLSVEADSDDRLSMANDIMCRFGAVDIGECGPRR
jgi:hypothetical protein